MPAAAPLGAILLAAGRSTRFRSASSKLLHPLAGKPLLHWPLAALRETGAAPIVVVVGAEADAVKACCGDGVTFAEQAEPRGTGHAVRCARAALASFDGDVLVLNADLPLLRAETLQRVVAAHRVREAAVTLATATLADPRGFGRILRGGGAVTGIVEERDATPPQRAVREVNVGIYCAQAPRLFELLAAVRPDNAQGEIYLTDVVAGALARGWPVADVPVPAEETAQVNSRGELAAMERVLRDRINAAWMEAGVTLLDPTTTYIEPDVTIGRDTVIGPNVQLRGRTRLGEGCRLDGTALLTDAVIGDRVHVRLGVVVAEAEISRDCALGPFANLRPGTRLAEAVHIGDFVETKNAVIGAGTKANHLAYLGDTTIGRDTNIGAGTITCNYDGFRKHHTVIGDRVQVGSDSQLVAPVALGDDVYVATGTTVRADVPAGALVYNPKPQQEQRGWVAARRAREAGPVRRRPAPKKPRAKRATKKRSAARR
jgi:bifunctional UDP-N-acetylglucosamine pyrophosphorylase/glucosamine-1-phosphate N-acetyltransferase